MPDAPTEAYEAAAKAYCLKFDYTPEAYVSAEARERHIANDVRSTAEDDEDLRRIVDAVWSLAVAEGRRLEAEERNEEARAHDWGR